MSHFNTNEGGDFEQFLKDTADMNRLYPSERVWTNIRKEVQSHARKSWYGAGLAGLLLLTTAAVTLVMTEYPPKLKSDNRTPAQQSVIAPAAPHKNKIEGSNIKTPFSFPDLNANATPKTVVVANNIETNSADELASPRWVANDKPVPMNDELEKTVPENVEPAVEATGLPSLAAANLPLNTFSFPPRIAPATVQERKLNSIDESESVEPIENVVTYRSKRKRFFGQFYIAPTLSYRAIERNLVHQKAVSNSLSSDNALLSTDVKSYIIHKPDAGLQIGYVEKFALFKWLNIFAGAQFNVSKYDIKAYKNSYEWATVKLNDNNTGVETDVAVISNYRVFGTSNTNWIKNLYYSVSVPLGLESNFKTRFKNTSYGFTVAVQPTRALATNAYVISSDLKNYASMPELVRKRNISSSFDFHINKQFGKTQLQFGPQLRYQHLSSYLDSYSLKENLFDIGIRVGVSIR